MIKTEYLGHQLMVVELEYDDVWSASYFKQGEVFKIVITGYGHTPEAALADAQKKIQQQERG